MDEAGVVDEEALIVLLVGLGAEQGRLPSPEGFILRSGAPESFSRDQDW